MLLGSIFGGPGIHFGGLGLARIQDAKLKGPGKVDLSKMESNMVHLGCTSNYQTGAKYLKTGKQRKVSLARRL